MQCILSQDEASKNLGVCAFYITGEFKEDVKCAMQFVEQVPDECEFKVTSLLGDHAS